MILHASLNFLIKWNSGWNVPILIYYSILGILLMMLYYRIIKTMKKLHWYEYERTKKANSSFLIGSILTLSMFIYFFVKFNYVEMNFNPAKLN